MDDTLLYFSIKYKGSFDRIYQAIKEKEVPDREILNYYKKNLKCKYTTIMNDDYPECLKSIPCPPFVIYYYGDLSLVDKKTIGVIGMRTPSQYGIDTTKEIVKDLVDEGYTIVSGLATGIDRIAHNQAIESKGKTIAILGCGIDYCYPSSNEDLYEEIKENHLLMSEYPLDLPPQKWYFPTRNRIVAGLSDALLITESKEKSGTMITVGFALEQGKEIYSVPSPVGGNNGCNVLIQQGAKLVSSAEDIINDNEVEYSR